ncbi:MAG: hypothetical protein FJZ87_01655 [Chloroflexi bacterium]|nr:hypothetical protein [Chloroflexota bacterium]
MPEFYPEIPASCAGISGSVDDYQPAFSFTLVCKPEPFAFGFHGLVRQGFDKLKLSAQRGSRLGFIHVRFEAHFFFHAGS